MIFEFAMGHVSKRRRSQRLRMMIYAISTLAQPNTFGFINGVTLSFGTKTIHRNIGAQLREEKCFAERDPAS